MNKMTRSAVVYAAYVFILMGFVGLGLSVAALAFQSPWAIVAGIAMVGSFGAAVVGFRRSSRATGNTWSGPEGTAHIDRYLATYREGAKTAVEESAVADERLRHAA